MTKLTEKEVRSIISNRTPIDHILQIIEYRDCWEIYGTAGGDALHYRLYKDDGELYEK